MDEIKCPCGLRNYMEEEDCKKISCNACCPLKKPQTNADRIRGMSDEELAELIVVKVKDIHHQGMRELAYSAWLKWLQQPAEGDDHA